MIWPLSASGGARQGTETSQPGTGGGSEKISINVAALVDTNVLVYRFDDRFPKKQKIATEVLRRGIADDSVRVPHQAIVEFIAATTRSIRGHVILQLANALREAEEFLRQFTSSIRTKPFCVMPFVVVLRIN